MPAPFQMPPVASIASIEQMQKDLQQCLQKGDIEGSKVQVQKGKLLLLTHNALVPNQQTAIPLLKTARHLLEIGALLAIRSKDSESFKRYYNQLQGFYDYDQLQAHPSTNKPQIIGLYLLLLLTMGDYAMFHTVLEKLIVSEAIEGSKSILNDACIKYPIELERSLMEGSYDQVWRKTSGKDVPGEEFALFSEVCMCQRSMSIH